MSRLDKFKKAMEKKDISTNFSPIPEWISFGNMALNHSITGHLRKGIPVSRSTFISGPQGSGKSFLMGNIVKNAQDKGYACIYIDTENSIDEDFMTKIGVDLSDDWFMPVRVFSVEEATTVVSEIFKLFNTEDKVGIFVDSLSNMESVQEVSKFEEKGELANTQGLVQKKYKQFVKAINNRIGDRNMFAVFTTHVYVNQDQYGDPFKISGGDSIQFIPSIGLLLNKATLKEGRDSVGIIVKTKTYKTRYQQLGIKTEFDLPYDRGMDEFDGVLPVLAEEGVVKQNAAWYNYTLNGETIKFQKKDIADHIEGLIESYDELKADYEPNENFDSDNDVEVGTKVMEDFYNSEGEEETA